MSIEAFDKAMETYTDEYIEGFKENHARWKDKVMAEIERNSELPEHLMQSSLMNQLKRIEKAAEELE